MERFLSGIQRRWASRLGNCRSCPLWRPDRGIHPKFGYGNLDSDIAIVGLSPNEDPDEKTEFCPSQYRVPDHANATYWFWASAAWNEWPVYAMIKALLSETEMEPWDIYFTNLCACSWNKASKEAKPDGIRHCTRYLYDQMRRLRPRLTVSFGREVYEALTGDDSRNFAQRHGHVAEGDVVSTVLVFLHWSFGDANMVHTDFPNEKYADNISRIFGEKLEVLGLGHDLG